MITTEHFFSKKVKSQKMTAPHKLLIFTCALIEIMQHYTHELFQETIYLSYITKRLHGFDKKSIIVNASHHSILQRDKITSLHEDGH